MVIFAEHRYYGKSLPYGNRSYEMPRLAHLAVDQVMSDYAVLLDWLKRNLTSTASPILAFGGSYGGMLAAWMRVKYPHIVTGAIASSAPILKLPGGSAPCSAFSAATTRTFALSAPGCDDAVRRTYPLFLNRSLTVDGREWLNENFRICNDSRLIEETDVFDLMYVISDAWRYMAMMDYPYPSDLLMPLPAWPVREACKLLTDPSGQLDDDRFLLNVRDAALIYYNHTGRAECLNLRSAPISKDELIAWSFQSCTELTFRRCQEPSDMFRPYKWDERVFAQACYRQYGVYPRFDRLTRLYGLERLKFSSNIIFSNGDLDPWSNSGINRQSMLDGADPCLVVINIPMAAHHYDLRPINPMDTPQVIEARNRMKLIVRGWIDGVSSKFAAATGGSQSRKEGKIEYHRL